MALKFEGLEPNLAAGLQSMCELLTTKADDHSKTTIDKLDNIEKSVNEVKVDLDLHKKEVADTFKTFIDRFNKLEANATEQNNKIKELTDANNDTNAPDSSSGSVAQPNAKRIRFGPALGTSFSVTDLNAAATAQQQAVAPLMGAPKTLRLSTFAQREPIAFRKSFIKTFYTDNSMHPTLTDHIKLKYGESMGRDILMEFTTHMEAKHFLTTYRDSEFLMVGDHQYYLGFAKFGRDKVTFILTGKVHKVLIEMHTAKTITLTPTPDKQTGALFIGPHKVATIKVGAEWCPILKKFPASIVPHAEAAAIGFDALSFCTNITRNILDKY
jgi:hypothetical protein